MSFLYATHRHELFYITVKYHGYIPNSFQVKEQTQNCIGNHQGEITQKVWKRELSFLYATHHHDLFYIAVKYHDYIPKGIQVIQRTRNCIWNDQGVITQKIWQRGISFLYATHRHDLFYITMKYHQNNPNGFQVMEGTRHCIWNNQGEITQKVWKWELSFSYVTHRHDLFYITVKYHDYIPKGIQVMERAQNCIGNHQGEITQRVRKQDLSFLYCMRHIVMTCST